MERLAGFSVERDRQLRVFAPSAHARFVRAGATRQRFVHYTDAPAAMSLIRIYKLPLTWRPGPNGASTALEDILDALIIGPCAAPRALRDAFVELLAEAGVADAAARVRMSDIPTR